MAKRTAISWDNLLSELARARETNDKTLQNDIYRFLSAEFEQFHQRAIGSGMKVVQSSEMSQKEYQVYTHSRHWDMEEARQALLCKVLTKGLGAQIQDVRSYLYTALKRQYIDVLRKEKRLREKDISYGHDVDYRMRAEGLHNQTLELKMNEDVVKILMTHLSQSQRVYLKLAHWAHWLNSDDMAYLTRQSGFSYEKICELTQRAHTNADYCIIIDGIKDPGDDKAYREMIGDRFRKRLQAAEKALKTAIKHYLSTVS